MMIMIMTTQLMVIECARHPLECFASIFSSLVITHRAGAVITPLLVEEMEAQRHGHKVRL